MLPKDFDRTQIHDSVTDEEIEQAFDGEPADFPDVDEDQDDLDETGGGEVVPATIPERCANAKRLRDDQTFVGVNRCLAVVRGPILGLPALYPTAAIAGDHSEPFHPITDPGSTSVPHGAVGFAWNGRAGHVWLELGGGLVSTTDFHRSGFEGVALRSRMLTWCGATRWGWGESVNGFDVWPDPAKPKPEPKPWTLADHADFIERRIHEAHKEGWHTQERRLKAWHDKMVTRLEARK